MLAGGSTNAQERNDRNKFKIPFASTGSNENYGYILQEKKERSFRCQAELRIEATERKTCCAKLTDKKRLLSSYKQL